MSASRLLVLCAVALLAAAPNAVAQAGVAVAGAAPAPDGARAMGPLCRTDTPAMRFWWTEGPGRSAAVAGSDGVCATVPAVVSELAASAEAARARAVGLGFPALVGDAAPAGARSPAILRALLRLSPASRARALGTFARRPRGAFLLGLTRAQLARMQRGLPAGLRARLRADRARALRGTPRDFVGGDRRVDIVLDASGATGQVQRLQPGLSPCRVTPRGGARAAFVASWVVVYAPADGPAPRAVLAHELFHVAQCVSGVGPGTPVLLREGTAEWFAALAEPAGFPGASVPGGASITSGNARAATFCTGFDPAGGGTAPYASWPVWEALDPGTAGPGAVRAMLRAFPGSRSPAPTAAAVVRRVGAVAWTDALRVAAREVCGNRRSPSGVVLFAPEVRDFLGAGGPAASPATPATLTVPAAGVATAGAVWGPAPVAAVTVRLSAPGVAPEALAAGVVVTTTAGPLAAVVRDGAVAVDVPPAALGERSVPVTVAGPLTTVATPVRVEVVTG
jgi:hypothetical protein